MKKMKKNLGTIAHWLDSFALTHASSNDDFKVGVTTKSSLILWYNGRTFFFSLSFMLTAPLFLSNHNSFEWFRVICWGGKNSRIEWKESTLVRISCLIALILLSGWMIYYKFKLLVRNVEKWHENELQHFNKLFIVDSENVWLKV